MPRLLCRTVETFDIQGRGTVVVLEPLADWRIPSSERVFRREAIRIFRPDRSSIRTFIKDIDFLRRSESEEMTIALPLDIPADAVPFGSMIFLERDGTEPIMWDGSKAEFSPPAPPFTVPA